MNFGRKCFILSSFGSFVENASFWVVLVGYSLECEKSSDHHYSTQTHWNVRKLSRGEKEAEAKVNENVECFATVTKKNKTAVAVTIVEQLFTSSLCTSFVLCSRNARSIKQPLFPSFHSMAVLFQLNCLLVLNTVRTNVFSSIILQLEDIQHHSNTSMLGYLFQWRNWN